ncbi:MAG: hypothetical protein GY928_28695 [Colwellia sp.]|nr:hypothetical protein [Colwellia sp.]
MPNFMKQEELVVDGSESTTTIEHKIRNLSKGQESLICFGNFGGATVEVETELRFADGQTSGIHPLPENGTHTAPFSAVVSIGYGSSVHIRVSGITATTRLYIQCNAVLF